MREFEKIQKIIQEAGDISNLSVEQYEAIAFMSYGIGDPIDYDNYNTLTDGFYLDLNDRFQNKKPMPEKWAWEVLGYD